MIDTGVNGEVSRLTTYDPTKCKQSQCHFLKCEGSPCDSWVYSCRPSACGRSTIIVFKLPIKCDCVSVLRWTSIPLQGFVGLVPSVPWDRPQTQRDPVLNKRVEDICKGKILSVLMATQLKRDMVNFELSINELCLCFASVLCYILL